MQTFTSQAELRAALGGSVGLVPTMGALHEGHLSLVRRARQENKQVVVSIFVNPTQFAPHEDLDSYPRTLEADLELLASEGVDFVFAPSVDEMYPELKKTGSFTQTRVVPGTLAHTLEGAARPGHFEGVCLVVSKLFNLVQPNRAYFGEKDYQQLLIVRQMVRDLCMPIEVVGCPIVREESGLARSSRNNYFSKTARAQAGLLYASIRKAKQAYAAGERSAENLRVLIREDIEQSMANVQRSDYDILYIEVCDAESLVPLEKLSEDAQASRILISINFEGTHLIDNADLSL